MHHVSREEFIAIGLIVLLLMAIAGYLEIRTWETRGVKLAGASYLVFFMLFLLGLVFLGPDPLWNHFS